MIRVIFRVRPDGGCSLAFRGHAGAGPYGADLVCAGVSALAITAAKGAQRLFDRGDLLRRPRVDVRSGRITVIAVPKEPGRVRLRQMFDTVCAGVEVLAQLYPEYVEFRAADMGCEI